MNREMKNSGIQWIGDIPSNWELLRNRYLFSKEKEIVGERWDKTQLLSLTTFGIKTRSTDDIFGKVPESYDGYQFVRSGQMVMCLFDLDCSAVFSGLSPIDGMISPAYCVLNCHDIMTPKFADYWFRFVFDGRKYNTYSKNIRFSLPYDDFREVFTAVPPLSEQHAIVRYLDSKCSAIDEAIERHKKIIEKMEEYKKIKIASYTSSFHSVKIGRFLSTVQTGPFGSQLHSEEYIENGIAVINPANIQDGEITIDPKCTITEQKAQELIRHLLQVGDIVIGRRGEMGRCAVVKKDGLLCGTGCFVIKCAESLLPEYASLCIRSTSAISYLTLNAIGTTMLNLNTDIILNCPIPYCDIETQRSIINQVNNVSSKCNEAVQKHQDIINKLEEYRKSIIYNAVTGKNDCRTEALK